MRRTDLPWTTKTLCARVEDRRVSTDFGNKTRNSTRNAIQIPADRLSTFALEFDIPAPTNAPTPIVRMQALPFQQHTSPRQTHSETRSLPGKTSWQYRKMAIAGAAGAADDDADNWSRVQPNAQAKLAKLKRLLGYGLGLLRYNTFVRDAIEFFVLKPSPVRNVNANDVTAKRVAFMRNLVDTLSDFAESPTLDPPSHVCRAIARHATLFAQLAKFPEFFTHRTAYNMLASFGANVCYVLNMVCEPSSAQKPKHAPATRASSCEPEPATASVA